MNKAEKAAAQMTTGKTNCAQTVISTFDDLGLDKNTALKITLGFGGGMGSTGKTCGAVTGSYMVLGLKLPFDPANPKQHRDQINAQIAEFNKQFIARHGSLICADLLGHNMGTAEGYAIIHSQGLTTKLCPNFVKSAVEILEELG